MLRSRNVIVFTRFYGHTEGESQKGTARVRRARRGLLALGARAYPRALVELQAFRCPTCGAPLPRHARWTAVTCAHCGASSAPAGAIVARRHFRQALAEIERERPASPSDVNAGGARYAVLRTLAHGERATVLFAERARRLTERVVIKARAANEQASIEREWEALAALSESGAQGAAHFTLRLPAPIARGEALFADGRRARALVTRAAPGFGPTLDEVRAAFPDGVDARHAAWMWRRLLELLGFVHRSGWSHGAVLPSHVVLNAREHGAMLVSWSRAARMEPGAAAEDLRMSAQAVAHALGADGDELSERVPAPVRELLERCAGGASPSDDAWRMKDLVAEAAERAFGPPTFVPFEMPPRRD